MVHHNTAVPVFIDNGDGKVYFRHHPGMRVFAWGGGDPKNSGQSRNANEDGRTAAL
jgi:hypothetical protein